MSGQNIEVLYEPFNPVKRVLFLGYNREQTCLIDKLMSANCCVHYSSEPIVKVKYDLVISYGYRHLIKEETIKNVGGPILNLHIGYLPYNRGAHPNFWAFFDNTPSGVTIHLVDKGIDTGKILFQKLVNFDNGEVSFSDTYETLRREIEGLFMINLENILSSRWIPRLQRGRGTLHFAKDLPKDFRGWEEPIEVEVNRLKELAKI